MFKWKTNTDGSQIPSELTIFKMYSSYSLNFTFPMKDSISEYFKIDEGNEVDYEVFRSPYNFTYLTKINSKGFLPAFGFGLTDGIQLVAGKNLFANIQAHIWLTTWFGYNNKYGLALTLNPFDLLVLGYGFQKIDAYAMGEGAGYDFAGFKVHDTKSLYNHLFDIQYIYKYFGLSFKFDYNPKYDLKSYSGGLSFFY